MPPPSPQCNPLSSELFPILLMQIIFVHFYLSKFSYMHIDRVMLMNLFLWGENPLLACLRFSNCHIAVFWFFLFLSSTTYVGIWTFNFLPENLCLNRFSFIVYCLFVVCSKYSKCQSKHGNVCMKQRFSSWLSWVVTFV